MPTNPPPPLEDDAPRWALGFTRREALLIAGVLLALVALAVSLIAIFWRPGPPRLVVMSTGPADGAYHAYAQRYREILARSGVTLELRPSGGAMENLARLRQQSQGVTLALVQGGLAQPGDADRLVSLGAVAFEPLWIFVRAGVTVDRVTDLKGKRIAGGGPGSGTRPVVEALLLRHGLQTDDLTLLPLSGLQAAEPLKAGTIDAAMMVASADAPAVRQLLREPGIALWSARRADAYLRQFPVLSRLDLPEGAADLERNLPPAATTLLAVKATLVATEDIHPVLVDLLLDAAREVHGGAGLLNRSGDFPSQEAAEYPMSSDAERFFKSGPSFLRRYLPYWAVVWIQRLIFFGLPILAIGIPLLRVTPDIYRWSVRRRIYRWYGELSLIERAVAQGRGQREAHLRRLDEIDAYINRLRVPPSFGCEAYDLRAHVQMVRQRLSA
jgi:TRAP transporter TAXI family solute receptor